MKRQIIILLILASTTINLSCATLSWDAEYQSIVNDVRGGGIDCAFLKMKEYLKGHPKSVHKQKIRFAICEYYFQMKDYRDAIKGLTSYIIDYPSDTSTPFAQAILYKALLEYKDDALLLEKLKNIFFSKDLFLVFSETKIKYYRSLLNNTYKFIDYIDKIEVFKNNELFFKISP